MNIIMRSSYRHCYDESGNSNGINSDTTTVRTTTTTMMMMITTIIITTTTTTTTTIIIIIIIVIIIITIIINNTYNNKLQKSDFRIGTFGQSQVVDDLVHPCLLLLIGYVRGQPQVGREHDALSHRQCPQQDVVLRCHVFNLMGLNNINNYC